MRPFLIWCQLGRCEPFIKGTSHFSYWVSATTQTQVCYMQIDSLVRDPPPPPWGEKGWFFMHTWQSLAQKQTNRVSFKGTEEYPEVTGEGKAVFPGY